MQDLLREQMPVWIHVRDVFVPPCAYPYAGTANSVAAVGPTFAVDVPMSATTLGSVHQATVGSHAEGTGHSVSLFLGQLGPMHKAR